MLHTSSGLERRRPVFQAMLVYLSRYRRGWRGALYHLNQGNGVKDLDCQRDFYYSRPGLMVQPHRVLWGTTQDILWGTAQGNLWGKVWPPERQ